MLNRLLPPVDRFTYTGSRISLWLLTLILIVKFAIAFGAIFNGHYAASVADGIPIDSYTPQGARAFLAVFASLGLSQFIVGLLGALVLLKYRALVPIFLLVLLIEYLARQGINAYLPIARSGGTAGGLINWAIFAAILLALCLSIRQTNVQRSPSKA